jgi:signal transduction histidine kinase
VRQLSLRARVIFGAILWTTGLFAITGVMMNVAASRHPDVPRILHDTFRHGPFVLFFALACMVYGLVQVRRGLSPMHRLRQRLAHVRDGRAPRLDGRYPAEVQPLVDDLNALIADREQRVGRAMAKAGDLAHGLKTPLAILANEARLLRGAGAPEAAATAVTIEAQVDRMLRQVDYHLAHARAAASGSASSARTPVHETVDGLVRALSRLHAQVGRGLTIENAAGTHAFRGERPDLEEMLGNLLDNACKWARARIAVTTRTDAGALIVEVDDDGPGIEPAMRDAVMRRGVRADETAPGSGLGLAIARELAELYGGGVTLGTAPMGGLRARLRLPLAD